MFRIVWFIYMEETGWMEEELGEGGRGAMLVLVRQKRDGAKVLAWGMECGLHIGLSSRMLM